MLATPMVQELRSKQLFKTLHIALFLLAVLLGVQATAQSVLLPGDVVIVSASADSQSIDFIPLIDIEEDTELYFSNGIWDDSAKTLTGHEMKIIFNRPVQAGTNIHLSSIHDSRLLVEGEIVFEGDTHRIFTYQKENSRYRFIFGVGWGQGPVWDTSNSLSSDVPLSLKENANTLLTLGEASNYQYYIRNGASGTRKLLLKYVGDAAHWRGNANTPFPGFGTSFNLLSPPVIIFENSVSTVEESDSMAVLNVAVYGHDGSRLSVDIVFDSLGSTASSDDFNGFSSSTINFTGLVGDAVFEVNIPIIDDHIYEGRETGIFTLQNPSKGNFGDFLSHSLVVLDNESPELLISEVLNRQDSPGIVEIQNTEKTKIPLKGWTLTADGNNFTFSENDILYPEETLQWVDTSKKNKRNTSANIIYSDLSTPLINQQGGKIILKNALGEIVNEVSYSKAVKNESKNVNSKDGREDLVVESESGDVQQGQGTGRVVNVQVSTNEVTGDYGWKVLADHENIGDVFPEKEFLFWNEEAQMFEPVSLTSGSESINPVIFGYFETEEVEALTDLMESSRQKQTSPENFIFHISATDKNENEMVDGLEGLNLVYNYLDETIPVYRFIEYSKANFGEIGIQPIVYGIKKNTGGELDFVKLEEEEEIGANAPFWVMLDSLQQKTELSVEREELLNNAEYSVVNETTEEDQIGVEIELGFDEHKEKLRLHFAEEGSGIQVKNLNSYPALFFQNQSFLNLAVRQGDDYFSELALSAKIEQELTLPLNFSTSESGELTFDIAKWEGIPPDWEIQLEDKAMGKRYNLRRDFSLTFEHIAPHSENEAENTFSLDEYAEEDRFVLHISPAKEISESEQEEIDAPRELELHQNFPNPFNPATTISFYLPESEKVRLSVFNIVGQPVAVIANGSLSAGEHQFEWEATDKPSGMYIYQLEVGKKVMTRKMTLVK